MRLYLHPASLRGRPHLSKLTPHQTCRQFLRSPPTAPLVKSSSSCPSTLNVAHGIGGCPGWYQNLDNAFVCMGADLSVGNMTVEVLRSPDYSDPNCELVLRAALRVQARGLHA